MVEVHYDEEAYLKTITAQGTPFGCRNRIAQLGRLEVSRGLTRDEAIEEARRCLHCDRNEQLPNEKIEAELVSIEAML